MSAKKPARNAPCPCGSGKKYKKCCYEKDQMREPPAVDIEKHAPEKDDRLFPEQQMMSSEGQSILQGILNIRRFMLKNKPHIQKYNRIRKMHSEIIDSMAQYYADGKFEQKIAPAPEGPDAQGGPVFLMDSSFDLDTRVGAQGFYDILIYKPAPNVSCITEDFLQNHRYRKPEKIEFLNSMLHAKLGLFEATGVDETEGYAYFKDVFTGETYTLTDIGLSGSENYDIFYIYTRIIQYDGVCFGTGLNFLFQKTDKFIQKFIRQNRENFNPAGEFSRFTQLYNQYSTSSEEENLVMNSF